MQIPTQEQCYRLMCDMKMMDHIVVHSMQVCRVATFLTENLNPQRNRLNHDLIRAAALLHDITKTRSFKTEENHALTGGEFLAEQGYAEVGDLVRQHVRLDVYPQNVSLREAEIINYADKRVLHENVVSLDKRAEYILEKYTKVAEDRRRVYMLWEKTREIEAEIFVALSFSPDDLNDLINAEDRSRDFKEYQRVCGAKINP